MYAIQKSRCKEPQLQEDVSPGCWLAHSSISDIAPGCKRTLWPFFGVEVEPKIIFYMPRQSEHCQCQVKTVCDIIGSLDLLSSSGSTVV